MEMVNLGTIRTIVRQVQEDGPEETIKAIKKTLNGPPWMCSTIHFEYAELLEKAMGLIEEGKLDELRKIDERLESLRLQDLFD
jgi:transcription initiation factor IIE alpha subunit